MNEIHIDWSYEEQGAEACRNGEPCDPPDKLHMIAAMSWAAGWLDENDMAYQEPEPTDGSENVLRVRSS